MYSFLAKNGQALAFALGMLLVILFLVFSLPAASGVDFTAMSAADKYNSSVFSVGLYAAIGLTILATIGMLAFGLIQMATSFKTSWKGVAGFVLILVIFFIAYSMTSTDLDPYMQATVDKFRNSGNEFTMDTYRFISASVLTALIMIALTSVAFLGSIVYNFFK